MTIVFIICLGVTMVWLENTVSGWISQLKTAEDSRSPLSIVVTSILVMLLWALFYYLSVHHRQ